MKINRPEITEEEINFICEKFRKSLEKRLKQHGRGSYTTSHELLGYMAEEYNELVLAVQKKDGIYEECLDVAVVGIFGAICHCSGKMEVD